MYFFFAFASIFAQSIFLPASMAFCETLGPSGFAASAFGASGFGAAGASAAMLLAAVPRRPAIPKLTMRIFFMTLLSVGCGLRMIQDRLRYKFFRPDRLSRNEKTGLTRTRARWIWAGQKFEVF